MKISVITVSYNSAATIRSAVDSVLGQSGVDLDYIVIDGASKDGTVDVLRGYGSRIQQLVSEPDGGIYDARDLLGTGYRNRNELSLLTPSRSQHLLIQ